MRGVDKRVRGVLWHQRNQFSNPVETENASSTGLCTSACITLKVLVV